ncbi:MAG: bifunctional demethylmenaquinone methyltransferase/2-methoxy-6-polyprenyl-1,4-benzoquinol methylase UbiE [Phycisphaerales bacterium]|nr:bifunctional demethylmenaquinone methyltransferase/2-methoxy-6-polyprenyl-1,4-benzoquinol methylase UbiE [Phycisphaerales bacterium]
MLENEQPQESSLGTETAWTEEELAENPHQACDKAKRVEAMFTAIAGKYDLNNRLHSLWQDQRWRKRAVELSGISQHSTVVDVACGTGDLSIAFKQAGAEHVIGIDFTSAMLDLALTKSTIAGTDIVFQQGDAMDLKLEDESADVVSIAFGIRNVQEPEKAIGEFYRILKPGGTLVILEFSTPSNSAIRFCNDVYTKHIMPFTATLIAGDTSGAYQYLPKSVETFSTAEELADSVEQCGFEKLRQFPQTFGVCTITRAMKSEA